MVNELAGSIPKTLTKILKPVQGKRVEIADAYKGYATRCREMGVKPASTVECAEVVRKTGIKIRMVKDLVYLLAACLCHVAGIRAYALTRRFRPAG